MHIASNNSTLSLNINLACAWDNLIKLSNALTVVLQWSSQVLKYK